MSLTPHGFGTSLSSARKRFVRDTITDVPREPAECDRWKLWSRTYGQANDSTVLCNPVGTEVTDTVVFPYHQTLAESTRFVFDPVLAAVRAGTTTADQWSAASTGLYSSAFGLDTVASGEGSVVVGGQGGVASGAYALAMNGGAVASGAYSLASGPYAQATHSGSLVISDAVDPTGAAANLQPVSTAEDEVTIVAAGGIHLTAGYTGGGVVGGPGIVVFQADTTTVAGDLDLAGPLDPTGLQLNQQASVPVVAAGHGTYWLDSATSTLEFSPDNAAAQVQLDTGVAGTGGGAFNATLVLDPATAVGAVRVRRWAPDASATPDFVFPGGSTESTGGAEEVRMQYTWADRAFRAGRATGAGATYWDAANRGQYSVGMGQNSRAQADYSTTAGGNANQCGAAADHGAVAGGTLNVVQGQYGCCVGGTGNNACDSGTGTVSSAVLGGNTNEAFASWAFVGGGSDGAVNLGASYSGIGVAFDNAATAQTIAADVQAACILAGWSNEVLAGANASFVGGGQTNDMGSIGGVCLGGGSDATPHSVAGVRAGAMAGVANTTTSTSVDAFIAGDTGSVAGRGSFVFGESIVSTLDYCVDISDQNGLPASTAASSWTAGFVNGFELYTQALPGQTTAVATVLANNDTAWSVVSDRAKKERVEPFDAPVLERLRQLPIYEYNYRGQTAVNRGPTAQDWHRLFPLAGKDRLRIENLEMDAVVLAGIKELAARVRGLEREVEERGRYTDELVGRLVPPV